MTSPPPRVLARIAGAAPGPTLLVVAALHGNERAGVVAAQSVAAALHDARARMTGDLVCLAGNRAALAAGRRQIARDLNRAWDESRIAELRAGSPPADAEDAEILELDREIEAARSAARGPVHVLDLHTTSGDGPPFTIAAGDRCAFAQSVPLTCLTGLLELLAGTMLVSLARRGVRGLVVEAGRHDDPASAERADAALWLALEAAGVLAGDPRADRARALLTAARRDLPATLRVFHRHAIRPGDAFRMRPGYRHFQPIAAGEHLADDANGEVRAPADGFILMPLYQGTGSDGFFLAR